MIKEREIDVLMFKANMEVSEKKAIRRRYYIIKTKEILKKTMFLINLKKHN